MYKILYLKTGEPAYFVVGTGIEHAKLIPAGFNTYKECEEIIYNLGRLVCINPDTNNFYASDTLVVMSYNMTGEPPPPYGWSFFNKSHLLAIVEI